MISTQNIYKAIRTRLNTAFPSITVQTKDIKNPLPPCFYIQYVSSNEKEVANDTINTIASFAIYYFATSKTLLDLLQKEQGLKHAFKKPLKVDFANGQNTESRFLNCDCSIDIEETDYILTMTIDFNFYQDKEITNPYDEYDNTSIMDKLEGV